MKTWVIAIIIGLLIGAVGTALRFVYVSGQNQCRLEQSNIVAALDKAWREDSAAKDVQLEATQQDLLDEQANVKERHTVIRQKVKVYVKDDTACNLTRGAVSLHNESWHGSSREAMQENPVITETEAKQTSTITQRALIEKDSEYAGYCEELEKSFDALVKGVDDLGY